MQHSKRKHFNEVIERTQSVLKEAMPHLKDETICSKVINYLLVFYRFFINHFKKMHLCDTEKNKQILAISKHVYLRLILRCLIIVLHILSFLNLDFLLAINFKGSTIIFCKKLSLYQDFFWRCMLVFFTSVTRHFNKSKGLRYTPTKLI